jgi:CubicO group peptidase (beta-lactamase class C family)
MLYLWTASTGMVLSAPSAAGPPGTEPGQTLADRDKDAFIQLQMRAAGIPGLQTVVVKDGRVVWAKSYGNAVLDQPGPRQAMGNESVVFSASVAKILVTVAVLQQVEKRKFSLDDDISKFVPFKVRNPAWPEVPITWRMLLSHTSSMNSEDDERLNATLTYGKDVSTTLDDYVRNAFVPGGSNYWAQRFAAGKPGTERIYSNDAVDLAGSALQGVVHKPLYEYLDEAILKPLGMTHTSYLLRGREDAPYAVGYASVRQRDGHYDYIPAKIYWGHAQSGGRVLDYQQAAPNYASGVAHTTALDFARLMLMLMNGGAVDGMRILQQSSVDLMMTPMGLRSADGWLQALCLSGPKDIHGRQVWGHNGEDRGAANAFYLDRQTGVGAISFANAMDPEWTMTYVVDDLDMHLMSWFE